MTTPCMSLPSPVVPSLYVLLLCFVFLCSFLNYRHTCTVFMLITLSYSLVCIVCLVAIYCLVPRFRKEINRQSLPYPLFLLLQDIAYIYHKLYITKCKVTSLCMLIFYFLAGGPPRSPPPPTPWGIQYRILLARE